MRNPKPRNIDPMIGNIIKNFRSEGRFKQEVFKVMILFLTEEEMKQLRQSFRYFDRDNTGYISVEELKEAMEELGHKMTKHELDTIIGQLKLDKNRKMLNYSEFLSALIDQKHLSTKERLWMAFRHFDVDDSGYITADNINEAMIRSGRRIPEEEIQRMIKEFDITKDGKISFNEFLNIMKPEETQYELPFKQDKELRKEVESNSLIDGDFTTPNSSGKQH
mmetsp:Transcript_15070/g.12786  ORF Transcript_15070/g.12786 Transcript_15070/m.12786 type:complete len:221 (+) Transcript_15070:1006-1668(+)